MLRQGRLSRGQANALNNFWLKYGLEATNQPLNLAQAFNRCAETVLEIGFGNGESLLAVAKQRPDLNFIGIEVHGPGVGALLQQLHANQIENIRIYRDDAVRILTDCITDDSLAKVQIFFPDPWHKKRHHKRRLIQTDFVALLARKLKPQGELHLATDWQDYAEHMMRVLSESSVFENLAGNGNYLAEKTRPLTKFEQRGLKLGHGIWDLAFKKVRSL